MRSKSQFTMPKTVVKEMGIEDGQRFHVVMKDGGIFLLPVVQYPQKVIERWVKQSAEMKKLKAEGKLKSHSSAADLIAVLHMDEMEE